MGHLLSSMNLHTSLNEQLMVVFALFSLILLLVTLWQAISLTTYKKIHQRSIFQILRGKTILDSMEGAWCAWGNLWDQKISFFHSNYFFKIFNFPPESLFELGPIFDVMQEDSQKKLQTKISLLHTDKIPFETEITLSDFKKVFVRGGYHKNDDLELYVLWFRESDILVEEEYRQLINDSFRLKNLLDIIPIPVWIRDDELNLKYVNKAYAKMLNSTPEGVVHKQLEVPSWKMKDDPHEFSISVSKGEQKKTKRMPTILDGKRKTFEVTETPKKQYGVHGGYALDFTSEESVKSDFEHYKKMEKEIFNSFLSTGVAIFDAETKLATYNHAYVKMCKGNENWFETRPPLGEILDDLRSRRMLPEMEDFKEYKNQRIEMFQTLTESLETILHQPDGKIVRMVQNPHPLGGIIMTFEDVTEYLKLESDLRLMLAVYKASVDHLQEGVLLFGADNRLLLSNPALGKLWGLDGQQIAVGKNISQVIEDIQPLLSYSGDWEDYKTYVLSNITDRIAKTRVIPLKSQKIYQLVYVPLPDGSNLLIFLDMAEKKQAEPLSFT